MSDAPARLNAALQGRYEIERELGEGGMAVVYLAKDLKHKRSVALKVLKPELAAVVGAERFLTEIETTANLQHPHILPLFDSGEAGGFLFYVMPYVEGETLRQRLDRERQLPIDEALGIITAVAGAVQTAHDQGVIHRDLKPGNILLSRGQPLVSDFGIALAVGAAGASRLTETGLSVGTPFYMSPEQATGDQVVGPATDIYALGCVLYEMLVGDPPYIGSTAQAVLGKIIQGTPVSATAARQSVPPNVDAAIRKALEKLPADRFTRADAFARALSDPGFRHGGPAGIGSAEGPGPWKRVSAGLAGLAAVLAIALGWSTFAPAAPPPLQPVKRFEIDVGLTQPLAVMNVHAQPALSPDGTQLTYSANLGDGQRLYVRRIDQLEARALPGTEGAYSPFFSPDGQWVAYHDPAQQTLEKISVQGGQPLTVAPAFGPVGGAWLDDGTIVFPTQEPGGFGGANSVALYRVPDAGGTPELLTSHTPTATAHALPQVLPGGSAVLYSVVSVGGGEGSVMAVSLETGEERTLVAVGSAARYAPSGHLVFARQGALWAVPFDPERLETTGQEVVVLQGLEMEPLAVPFTFSLDGLLVYMPGTAGNSALGEGVIPRSFVWVNRQGREEPLRLPTRQYQDPRLSPDGSRVAVAVFDGQVWDLWVYDVRSGAGLRLTHVEPPGAGQMVPMWTPDGRQVIYRVQTGGDLYWVEADGSGAPEPLVVDAEFNDFGTSVTPDGRTLLFSRLYGGGNLRREIWSVPLEGKHTPAPVLEGQFAYGNGSLSPDGQWLAYFSNESGDFEIYLQRYPGGGAKTPVSIGGGQEVVWSRDGSELYYRRGTDIMVVEVQTAPALRLSEPSPLFQSSHFTVTGGGTRQYHVAPDGRFLMLRSGVVAPAGDPGEHDHFVAVENWFDELRRLAPVR